MASQISKSGNEGGGGGEGVQISGLHKWSNDSKNQADNKNLSMKCGQSAAAISTRGRTKEIQ
jgi:hypothetical protein